MRWRVKEVPVTPPSGIPGEHHTTKATAKALMSNREGDEERKTGGRGRKSTLSAGNCFSSLPASPGPVLPRDHCEKVHSSHSRKICDVNLNKPVRRTAARAGKWANSHLDTQHTCFNAEYPTYSHRTPLSYPVFVS